MKNFDKHNQSENQPLGSMAFYALWFGRFFLSLFKKAWRYTVMFSKTRTKLIAVLMTIIILAAAVNMALAADKHTVTLRYYDDIQITFKISYPSGGVWSGAQDVPIGGTSLSSQIYCVDPFTPFHGEVSALGRSFWSQGTTTDEVSGYVSAAPWAMSGAMQKYGDAVRWIASNGYRGVFGHHSSGIQEDAESRASVERLISMYGDTNINKEIALMATKVAIWYTVAGRDNIQIVHTTLDGRLHPDGTAMLSTFNNLVSALTADGENARQGKMPVQSVPITTLTADINDSGAFFDLENGRYGPFSVTASLNGLPHIPSAVHLTASGSGSQNFSFVDSAFNPLMEDSTITNAFSVFSTTNTLSVNNEFYLLLPASPNGLENMTIRAMVVAEKAPVVQGTPVVYAYWDGDQQDWTKIQAFIGAASRAGTADLFAEASVNTGTAPRGQIWVSKQVENAAITDMDVPFEFELWHTADIIANPTGQQVSLSNHPVRGAEFVIGDVFSIRKGTMAFIDGLPAGPNDWYKVVEINHQPIFDSTPSFYIDIENSAIGISGMGADTGWFQMDTDGGQDGLGMVTFTNRRAVQPAQLRISKTVIAFDTNGEQLGNDAPIADEFIFRLQLSGDNGVTWSNAALSIDNFRSGGGRIVNGAEGLFILKHRDMAIIELPPSEPGILSRTSQYRIVEEPSSPGGYASVYGLYVWREQMVDGQMQWVPDPTSVISNYTGTIYGMAMGDSRETGWFPLTADGYYDLVFLNIATHDLQISKNVTGSGDRDKLFEFQVFNLEDPNAVRLTSGTSATADAKLVEISGNPSDRVGGTNNDILMLRHGETATIKGLPPGRYTVRELAPGEGYTTSHTVRTGSASESASLGLETAPFTLFDTVRITFTNDISETPVKPRSPEAPNEQWEPNQPLEPNQPNEPFQPNQPNSPETNGTYETPVDALEAFGEQDTSENPNESEAPVISARAASGSPQTGDSFPIAYAAMLFLGMACLTTGVCSFSRMRTRGKYRRYFEDLDRKQR